MLVNFLYSHPTWLVGLLVIGIWTGLSLAGLYLFHRLVDVHMRHKDTETVGLTYAIVAVVYAVLIAFIVVNVFETFAKGDEIATAEANKLSNLMRASMRRYTSADQKLYYPGDTFFDQVEALNDQALLWNA